ncbi:MAG: phosphate acetyltransferase [Candidatus Omnitrophica bacterium]|nr:phosphate acetyltransferase [Candidatus Omnitrophota bacterium]
METINLIRDNAKKAKAKIVLPEGEEARVIKAAAFISKEKIADLIVLGDEKKTRDSLLSQGADMEKIEVIEIKTSPLLEKYISIFYELRKHKNITPQQAREAILSNSLFFGALLVREHLADGFVAGSVNTTSDVARSALWCLGLDRNMPTMSSSFVMIMPDKSFGEKGVLVFADCGIVPEPSQKQLANIAIASSDLMTAIFDVAPRVAMLSFSTKGSAKVPETEKITAAVEIVKKARPDILIDGELQADAALIPEVAGIKAPGSPIEGKANVLIFPSLEAGNISYKLTQRLAKARALGPLLQGLLYPCSDLSRGCSWEDIVDIVALTVLRHASKKGK